VPLKATTAPTDRSIPPAIITSVTPTPTITISAAWLRMSSKLAHERNRPPVRQLKKSTRSTSAINGAASRTSARAVPAERRTGSA
jgi:hypothetical protein